MKAHMKPPLRPLVNVGGRQYTNYKLLSEWAFYMQTSHGIPLELFVEMFNGIIRDQNENTRST